MGYEFEPACRRMEQLEPFYRTMWEEAFKKAIPISGTFELTPRCNFNCRMCYVHLKEEQIHKYGREMTAKEWLKTAQEAKEAGTLWLCITGGEPLMYPEFPLVYRELSQMGFFVSLQTNASLVRGKMAKLLEEYPPVGVKVTLYGSNDDIYEKVCGVKNGFTRTDEGIQTLISMGIPVKLISTVIRQNEADVQNMAYYAMYYGLPWGASGEIKASARGAKTCAGEVRVQEKLDEQKRKNILRCLEKAPADIERKPCTYCRDYRIGYWVTWNGYMRMCSFMNEPDIPVRKQPFLKSWRALLDYEEALQWPEECSRCRAREVCFKCAGTLAAECGSPDRVTEEFCGRIKKLFDEVKGD